MNVGPAPSSTGSPLRRIFANTAWLIGGKGFGALCGIIYLAILTRSLGLKDFGHFSLIFATAQALIALAGFETWRVVIQYGAEYVHRREWDRLGRLSMTCALLDTGGAILGCGAAFVAIYGFADILDLNREYMDMAFWFCCAMLMALVSTPTGIVRALHRFDRAVYVEAIVPVGRLLSAAIIWWTGPSVARFLIAWALIDLAEAALYWVMARRLAPEAVRFRHLREWRRSLAENPRLLRFALVTHAGGTIDAIMRHGPLLAAGGLAGTKAAGLYRLASQVTQALGKLSALLARSVYAEAAHVRASAGIADFRRLAIQTSALAAGAGGSTCLLAHFLGADLLALIGGETFREGAAILVPLAVAASFELASVAFEPILHSMRRAGSALAARIGGVAVMAAGILALSSEAGAEGIAWAVALGSGAAYAALAALSWFRISRL